MIGIRTKVLLIEDNPGDARLIQEMLKESGGYDLEMAGSLTKGIEMARNSRYDVMILDLGLPDSCGLDSVKAIQGRFPDLPVVVLTGLDDEECALDSIKQGAQDYLIKGRVDVSTLNRVLKYAMERKQAGEALRKSEEQASAALEAARGFTFSYDIASGNIIWGGALQDITGYSPEEFAAVNIKAWEHMIHPDDREQVIAVFKEALDGKERVKLEYRVRTKIGYITVAAISITEKMNGIPIRLVGIMQDITEQKLQDQKLERLNLTLEEKNKEMQQLFHITSHDLRSPLANTMGFSEDIEYFLQDLKVVLETYEIPDETKAKIEQIIDEDITVSFGYIKNALGKMDNLIMGLLRISRLGTAELEMEDLDMRKMLGQISDTFAYELKQKGIMLDILDTPDCVGDQRQINQVFSNIIGNSIKYHDPEKVGNIIVNGRTKENRVVYSIKDNGIGIAEDHQEKVFGMFQRVDKKSTPGDGLGLTAVQRILSRHDGKIWFESEFGKGSTFFIELPAVGD